MHCYTGGMDVQFQKTFWSNLTCYYLLPWRPKIAFSRDPVVPKATWRMRFHVSNLSSLWHKVWLLYQLPLDENTIHSGLDRQIQAAMVLMEWAPAFGCRVSTDYVGGK